MEERFAVNLIAAYVVVLAVLLISYILRRLVQHFVGRLFGTVQEGHRVHSVGKEMAGQARALVFWTTIIAMGVSTAAGVAYHFLGRDIRHDLRRWWFDWVMENHVSILGAAVGVSVTV